MDYLGALARTLGDLTGYSILAFELIQNADDAGASQLVFTFTDDALEAWNDGVFSDCERQDLAPDDCPMREPEGHRCDFHSFRSVSSEDKRHRDHTIGAFGIGFTAVYQITDRPELISSDRHWVVDETNPESERIDVCAGCPRCASNPPGTTFILPWARDERSTLRRRLLAPAVGSDGIDELRRELVNLLPTTVLFLRHLDHLEVRNDATAECRITRHIEEVTAVVQVNDDVETWLLFRESFAEEAYDLRAKYGDKVEASRHDEVVVAVPVEHSIDGKLCAYLPTRESTGLPFHVNADFFPASDRTRLPDEGHRGDWNRAAVQAAAESVAARLTDLRNPLGPERLWELIQAAWSCRRQDGARGRDEWLGFFWSELAGELAELPVFHTSAGEWVRCRDGVTIRQLDEERPSIPLLERLGLKVVHPDLHATIYSLPRVEVLGTRELGLSSLVDAIRESDFASPDEADLPEGLLEQAWRELDLLLGRPGADPSLLDDVGLAPTIRAGLARFASVRRADDATRQLFGGVAADAQFLDEARLRPYSQRLAELVPEFDADDAVATLETLETPIEAAHVSAIMRWFAGRAAQVDQSLGQRLAALPIFPTTAGPKALVDLSIPGGFDDELGLAELVDIAAIPFALSFLRQLGARELTIEEYARRVIPANTAVAESDPPRWRRVVELLAREGELRDEPNLHSVLSRLPLIETGAGFTDASEAYFPSAELDRVLVEYVAVKPPTHESIIGFYEWLGVAGKPRVADLLARVDRVAAGAVTSKAVRNVEAIVAFLPNHEDLFEAAVPALSRKAWLPADRDMSQWYRPNDLAAGYQRYLFETQAAFLRLPLSVQRSRGVNVLFEALGVQTVPTPEQVVGHLLECAELAVQVNNQVYRYLSENSHQPALARLVGRPCILTPDGGYLRPEQLFRRWHPFGRFRSVLGDELSGMESLWERLRIRESPDASDAIDVLIEIGDEYGESNDALDEEAFLVVMAAWRLIERALDEAQEVEVDRLAKVKCIPDARRILLTPDRALFDDAPEYADALRSRIGEMLMRKPEGAWRAMARVGVRSLAERVQVELHEADDEVDDLEARRLIAERRRQILRAIDPLLSGSGAADLLARLDDLSFTYVSRLQVVYRLRLPGSSVDLGSDVLPATTVLLGSRLLRTGDSINAVELARELAKRIAPAVERTALVPALALALQPGTPEQADASLDSAGVPRLESTIGGSVIPAVLDVLGGDELAEGEEAFVLQALADSLRHERTPVSQMTESGAAEPAEPEPEAEGSGPADDFEDRAAAAVDGRHEGVRARTSLVRPSAGGTRRTFLRSYVSLFRGEGDDRGAQLGDERSETDAAGVAAVLAYERSYGRQPTTMPHDNPGYDIESCNPVGEADRYIEVKSLKGDWTELGAGLSSRQYRDASQLRDRFWLYVVEHATTDPRVYPIQDPINRVDQFMFDDNWKLVSESRRRALPEIEIVFAGDGEPREGMVRVPILKDDGAAVREWEADGSSDESVDVAVDGVRFVCRTNDGRLWAIGDPPHDRERTGRLLLVELEKDGEIESTIGWYRVFTSGGRVVVELTPEVDVAAPIMLHPDYEVDIAVLGEVLGRAGFIAEGGSSM